MCREKERELGLLSLRGREQHAIGPINVIIREGPEGGRREGARSMAVLYSIEGEPVIISLLFFLLLVPIGINSVPPVILNNLEQSLNSIEKLCK